MAVSLLDCVCLTVVMFFGVHAHKQHRHTDTLIILAPPALGSKRYGVWRVVYRPQRKPRIPGSIRAAGC